MNLAWQPKTSQIAPSPIGLRVFLPLFLGMIFWFPLLFSQHAPFILEGESHFHAHQEHSSTSFHHHEVGQSVTHDNHSHQHEIPVKVESYHPSLTRYLAHPGGQLQLHPNFQRQNLVFEDQRFNFIPPLMKMIRSVVMLN